MRKIAFICCDQFQSLDLTGPMEVFAAATMSGQKQYDIQIFSKTGGIISSSTDLLIDTKPLKTLKSFNSMIVVGGAGIYIACEDKTLIRYIQQQATNTKRIVSICTGSFLLAKAGLLNNKKATTHWDAIDRLAQQYPKVTLEPDALYVRDGNIITSAGVTAGIDMALALVEEDVGRETAMKIARELVVFYHRPGGQSQFSMQLKNQTLAGNTFQALCDYIIAHPEKDHCIPALADYMHMSPRNFSRCFTEELNISPGKYVEQARLEAAKRTLEESQKTLEQIAKHCGFNSVEILRRAFQRHYSITPTQYRDRFSK